MSDYNTGRWHGAWIDAAQEPEELRAGIQAMLDASPTPGAEEWAVFDFTGFFGINVGEWADLAWVSQIARGITEHGEAFARWALVAGTDGTELAKFDDAYRGEWKSLADYADEFIDVHSLDLAINEVVPEWLQPYVRIDTAALARDWQQGGELYASQGTNGSVYVFDRSVVR